MIQDTYVDFAWFPLENPGLVSIPLAFLLGIVGTLLSKETAGPREVRRDGGPLAHRAPAPRRRRCTDPLTPGRAVVLTGRPPEAGDEDRRAGQAARRAPGPSRPRCGRARRATPARRAASSTNPAPTSSRDVVAERAVVLGVQRPRPASSVSTYGRRSKYERVAVSPRSPGSSGNAQRTGWVTANTHRPPGPQHARDLGVHPVGVGHERAARRTR